MMKLEFDISNKYMELALQEAKKSIDPSTQNGAVLLSYNNQDYTWAHNRLH